jgi:hypothetical protein
MPRTGKRGFILGAHISSFTGTRLNAETALHE